MSRGDKNKQAEDKDEQDGHATEGGFGTGLRAQLEKRRTEQSEPEQPAPVEEPETPLVRFDLETPTALEPEAEAEPSAEAEELRNQLAEAQKRERELRAAFAEQV